MGKTSGVNLKRKSVSLFDIANISTSSLNTNLDNSNSTETLHCHSLASTTKSKDSGIHRSTSCLSFTSGNRSYDHVTSKVKEYIQNIKKNEAQRKKNQTQCIRIESPLPTPVSISCSSDEPETLKKKINELEFELKEKSILLDAQQQQYNALLYKYAEAQNYIDSIRLQRINNNYGNNVKNDSFLNSSTFSHTNLDSIRISNDYFKHETIKNKGIESTNGSVCNNLTDSSTSSFPKHSTPLASPNKIKNVLGPVSSIFSSSSRLDKQFVPFPAAVPFRNKNESQLSENYLCSPELSMKSSNSPHRVENSYIHSQPSPLNNSHEIKPVTIHHIDLPKEAPFDKVKKWRESLPNISLLNDTSSSSGSDTSDESSIDNGVLNTSNIDFVLSENSPDQIGTCIDKKIQSNKSNLQVKFTENGCQSTLRKTKKCNSVNITNIHKDVKHQCSILQPEPVTLTPLSVEENNNLIINFNKLTTSYEDLKHEIGQQTEKLKSNSTSIVDHNNSEPNFKSQGLDKVKRKCKRKPTVSIDEITSDDELSLNLLSSAPPSFSTDNNLKQLVKSEDSSSVSSSVLDSVNDFYNFVQKRSPKRKVNCLNYYSPCKVAKLKESSSPVIESSNPKKPIRGTSTILVESSLNHLFPKNTTKIVKKFQSGGDENVWWKNSTHTQYQKSKNLQECLKRADYFINIFSEGLEKIESFLSNSAKVV